MPAELIPLADLRPLPGWPQPDRAELAELIQRIRAHGILEPLLVRPATITHVVQEGRLNGRRGWFVLEPRLARDGSYHGEPDFFATRSAAEAALPADVPYEVVHGLRRLHAARIARLRQVQCRIAELTDEEVRVLRASLSPASPTPASSPRPRASTRT